MQTVKFTQMKDGTKAEYIYLEKLEESYANKVGERLLTALESLTDTLSGYQVSRLEHSLQSATRAYYDGADNDWIVSALLHDIGDLYAPYNHDEYAATILSPYVREQCTWVVAKHGVFQKQYYAHHLDGNPNDRERYQGHPYFDDCDYFCEHWDQASFDPDYPSFELDFFRPIVLDVFSRKINDKENLAPGKRVSLHCSKTAKLRKSAQ